MPLPSENSSSSLPGQSGNLNETVESDANLVSEDGVQFLDRATGMDCWKCDGELDVALVQGFKVAGCMKCHGLLIQTSFLAGLINIARANFESENAAPVPMDTFALKKVTHCITCDMQMDTHPYNGPGNIVIDSCHRCGLVWLDAGELRRVIEAPGVRELRPSEVMVGFESSFTDETMKGAGESISGMNMLTYWLFGGE